MRREERCINCNMKAIGDTSNCEMCRDIMDAMDHTPSTEIEDEDVQDKEAE
jgi:hypothetical protein